jgi:hypothetical protein
MAPIVHGLEAEFYDQINFVYLNIEDPLTDPFKKQLAYRYQPHFFLIDGEGNVLQQWLGPVNSDQFRDAFEAALQ